MKGMTGSEATTNAPMDPASLRALIRTGDWSDSTFGICPEFVHANLIVLRGAEASDFFRLAHRNPMVFPLLEVTNTGDPTIRRLAPGADVTTDYPRYLVYRRGELVEETTDVRAHWTTDSVGFLTGSSALVQPELAAHGLLKRDPAVYESRKELVPSDRFHGTAAVSAMAVPSDKVSIAVQISARYPLGHGAPCHIGNPAGLGIDLDRTVFGFRPLEVRQDEVPVFWVTAGTTVLMAERGAFEFVIVHKPAHWLVGDLRNEQFREP